MKKTIFVLSILLFIPFMARAETETIRSFDSTITVHEDSSMAVTETIEVYAGNDSIKHGIYRDFPTRYKDEKGYNYVVGFFVEKVLLDDEAVQYKVMSISNGKRVLIGDPDSYVPIGWHTYEITYSTDSQLGYFDNHDELYWNVTGNGWEFSIEKATARVELPANVRPFDITFTGYTGKQGERGKDFSNQLLDSGAVYFETVRTLESNEGFSIVVGWPKGFVHEPTQAEREAKIFKDNIGVIAGVFGVLLGVLYYVIVWSRVGKDPKKGTIIAQYEPPQGMNAGQIRYLLRYGYDNKVFAAVILEYTVNGYITISEKKKLFKKYYTLTRILPPKNSPSSEDIENMDALFGGAGSLEVDIGDAYHKHIMDANASMKESLKKALGKYFTLNIGWWLIGFAIFVASFISYVVSYTGQEAFGGIFVIGILAFSTIIIVALMKQVFEGRKSYQGVGGKIFFMKNIIVLGILFAFVGFFDFSMIFLSKQFPQPLYFFIIPPTACIILFYFLMRKPTVEGRQVLDHIEGFKWFLEVTEKDRMNFHNPPGKTPELFEKFLPYALALGVEHKWAEQFSEVFKQMEAQGMPYHPIWYMGTGFNPSNPASFGDSFGSSLNHAITASSVRPGSSSGFGGGGGSGGGGGGGGGGGW